MQGSLEGRPSLRDVDSIPHSHVFSLDGLEDLSDIFCPNTTSAHVTKGDATLPFPSCLSLIVFPALDSTRSGPRRGGSSCIRWARASAVWPSPR